MQDPRWGLGQSPILFLRSLFASGIDSPAPAGFEAVSKIGFERKFLTPQSASARGSKIIPPKPDPPPKAGGDAHKINQKEHNGKRKALQKLG